MAKKTRKTNWQTGWGEFELLLDNLIAQLKLFEKYEPPKSPVAKLLFAGLQGHLKLTAGNARDWQRFTDNKEIRKALDDEIAYLTDFRKRLKALDHPNYESKNYKEEWVKFFSGEIGLNRNLKKKL